MDNGKWRLNCIDPRAKTQTQTEGTVHPPGVEPWLMVNQALFSANNTGMDASDKVQKRRDNGWGFLGSQLLWTSAVWGCQSTKDVRTGARILTMVEKSSEHKTEVFARRFPSFPQRGLKLNLAQGRPICTPTASPSRLRYYLSRLYARHPQPERPSQPCNGCPLPCPRVAVCARLPVS